MDPFSLVESSKLIQTKPSSNETTTPVLKDRGPRRAALGSGSLGGWACSLR